VVVRVSCIEIGAGGGTCLGEADIEADLDHIEIIGAAAPGDADGDGVLDAADDCPGTAAGATVDANGCSSAQLDDDSDGVFNDKDRCANTPAGATVDAVGCTPEQAVLDDDNDGVLNASDACPNTAAGDTVDANGCSAAQRADTSGGGGSGVGGSGVGALAPAVSSIPTWGALASALGGAGLLGSLGAFASRILRRRR
jgi:hypothetical protein